MPTQITSSGITFNDTTSLTSANIGTAQLVNGSVTASKLGTNEQKQIAKAWVNFNGTGTIGQAQTIRSSYNVSSVTKNGTGDYTINFTTAMADANYSVIATSGDSSSGIGSESTTAYNLLTSSFKITSATASSGSTIDRSLICAAIFGN
jgi:hypothetical protein